MAAILFAQSLCVELIKPLARKGSYVEHLEVLQTPCTPHLTRGMNGVYGLHFFHWLGCSGR